MSPENSDDGRDHDGRDLDGGGNVVGGDPGDDGVAEADEEAGLSVSDSRLYIDDEFLAKFLEGEIPPPSSCPRVGGKSRASIYEIYSQNAALSQDPIFEITEAEAKDKDVKIETTTVGGIEIDPKRTTSARCISFGKDYYGRAVFVMPRAEDRAHTSGMTFYWKSACYGVRFPFSAFVTEILTTLAIAPSQLTGVAWCSINSFEIFFEDHADRCEGCPFWTPTLSLFLQYYLFMPDKSWITVRKRTNKISGANFHSISKCDAWSKGFFILPETSSLYNQIRSSGVPVEWNLTVTLPGRRPLAVEEKACALKIKELCEMEFPQGISLSFNGVEADAKKTFKRIQELRRQQAAAAKLVITAGKGKKRSRETDGRLKKTKKVASDLDADADAEHQLVVGAEAAVTEVGRTRSDPVARHSDIQGCGARPSSSARPAIQQLGVKPISSRVPRSTIGIANSQEKGEAAGSQAPLRVANNKTSKSGREKKKIDKEINLEELRSSMSFCSTDMPAEFGAYARTVFGRSVPTSLKRELGSSPLGVLAARMVSDAFYLGSEAFEMLRRADNYETVIRGEVPAAWRRQWEEERTTLGATVDSLKQERADLLREKSKQDESVAALVKRVEELELREERRDAEVKELQGALVAKDVALKEVEEQLATVQTAYAEAEETLISEFLGSRSFAIAALTAAGPPCRSALYSTVSVLGRHWPLEPEEFNIHEVESGSCLNLTACVWKREEDELVAPNGEIMEPPSVGPTMEELEAVAPRHPWPISKWPMDGNEWTGDTLSEREDGDGEEDDDDGGDDDGGDE